MARGITGSCVKSHRFVGVGEQAKSMVAGINSGFTLGHCDCCLLAKLISIDFYSYCIQCGDLLTGKLNFIFILAILRVHVL